ncbi:MAG: NADPH-dependent oxidoreductase [Bacteroidales bacterium]|nr:NADPH-dependent oxidoreductase [Bacteroidales bacterium]MBN2697751.1 NADPH-dependent oxidoreductase [Bacteroidales bacterium]
MHQTILNHRSIRKYKKEPLPEHLLERIIEAGTRASTTGNMQVYSIIVTTDPEIRKALVPCHFNQPMVLEAPVIMTFCADFNRFNKWCRLRNAHPGYDNFLSFMTAAIDALLVAQNVCLAAEDSGLGICYLGTTTYMASRIIEILELPPAVVPVTAITIGFPDESPGLTDRLPLEAVVHMEKYRDYDEEDINRLYAAKEALESSKAFVKENSKENLAQVFTDIRYTLKDNRTFSNSLLNVLKKQGFMNQ